MDVPLLTSKPAVAISLDSPVLWVCCRQILHYVLGGDPKGKVTVIQQTWVLLA